MSERHPREYGRPCPTCGARPGERCSGGPIRVRVVLSIAIDPAAYRAEYGEPSATLTDVREYVRTAVQDAAQSALAIVGADVSLQAI